MEPEIQPHPPKDSPAGAGAAIAGPHEPLALGHYPNDRIELPWMFFGSRGLRAGWSMLIVVVLYRFFSLALGTIAVTIDPALARLDFSPASEVITELVPLMALLAAVSLVARLNHLRVLDYNLSGPRPMLRFFCGLGAGFAALSVLVGALTWGGWLQFGPVALSGTRILGFAVLWGAAFLVVSCFEEGSFRCFLQFTLTRSINFWWALAIVAVLCLDLQLRSHGEIGIIAFLWLNPMPTIKGDGFWGVYVVAILGLVPCLSLHLNRTGDSGFWQAAWVTSTLFGFIHTTNKGENWIGIFAAALIGFVFCVSIRVTGSAWWAIGCHAAWDWAETYFYGTADSGLIAQSHYLTSIPAGSVLWSGGTDGPEGSILVLPVVLLLLAALIVLYGRRKPAELRPPLVTQAVR
jgi:membrane protease YdiL (CAAX protease family)